MRGAIVKIAIAFISALTLSVLVAAGVAAKGAEIETQANVPVEISLHASRAHADPFNDVTLDLAVHRTGWHDAASAGILGRRRPLESPLCFAAARPACMAKRMQRYQRRRAAWRGRHDHGFALHGR